ncbi:hypothetical protein THAOC_21826 [Thalassiosira oceanica]|uniref:Uncharacterized protein n=1 Tax=Thalassiosira oceanica TaxID=159749 RepID=K0RW91_THAOC|nr:hypothetical protein THAOC_21826 [Thalassiosira oceanica]|eukprot:EJK58073.1 hypothetical protein THAOC_21826 [Thalassiosira oceanica]
MRASLLLLFSSSVGLPSPSLAVTDVAAPWKASPDAPDGQGQKFGLLDRRRRRSAINRAQDHGRNAYARKQDGKKVMTWISIVVLLKILFFFRSFASPFFDPLGLVIRASYYVWQLWRLSGGSVSALVAAFKLRTEEDDERKPLTRESRSFSFLAMEAVKNEPRKKRLPELVKFQRPFRRLARSALVLSASLCVVYLHCWSRTLSAFDTSRGGGLVCQGIFLPLQVLSLLVDQTSSLAACEQEGTCASEQLIWVLWALGISSHLFYYLINEFAGKHHKDYREPSIARKSSDSDITQNGSGAEMSDEDDDDGNVGLESNLSSPRSNQHGTMRRETWPSIAAATLTIQRLRQKDEQQPQDILPMVSWYSNMIFATGFDMLLASKVFLGRFDERKMQYALLRGTKGPTSETELARPLFDFSKERRSEGDSDGFWFDWMSDCGDGFHSSYQVARLLAQPSLDVVTPSHGTRALPRGKLLVIGGDLAYPGPTPFNYEQRFFRTFEDAMSPPPSYRKEHISIKKPALPVKGWDADAVAGDDGDALQNYEGPVTFIKTKLETSVPGNHDWFDGLAAYTRYILSRDWLGGWLIPQRTSYFALKLPKNWWLLGFDLALDDDINIEQFHFFANLAENDMQKDDNVVVASHVPHWVLEDYEEFKHDEKETNLRELIKSFLKIRVRLRLAGDLHHYTRHVPCEERSVQPQLVVSGAGGHFFIQLIRLEIGYESAKTISLEELQA